MITSGLLVSWNPYKKVSFFNDPIESGIGPEKPQPTNALENELQGNISENMLKFR